MSARAAIQLARLHRAGELTVIRIPTEMEERVRDEDDVHLRDVHRCVTIEGNTNGDGGSNGHSTLRKVRTFREADGHRFIRWAEIVRLAVAA